MFVVALLVTLLVPTSFTVARWYEWHRLIRDTNGRRSVPRGAGNVVFVAGPILAMAALIVEQAPVP